MFLAEDPILTDLQKANKKLERQKRKFRDDGIDHPALKKPAKEHKKEKENALNSHKAKQVRHHVEICPQAEPGDSHKREKHDQQQNGQHHEQQKMAQQLKVPKEEPVERDKFITSMEEEKVKCKVEPAQVVEKHSSRKKNGHHHA